jgi:nitrogen regulatory protein P-II 1
LVPDSAYKQIVDDILNRISTGSTSDGKIFVKDISETYDNGTRQIGEVAL